MDNNIFSKIAKQMNKYGDSFAKHSEKALQSAISSSEKLANKGKITIQIEKLNIELKKSNKFRYKKIKNLNTIPVQNYDTNGG